MATNCEKLGIIPEHYDEIRKEVVLSMIKFIIDELRENALDSEQKESLAVAKQCIEACYEIGEERASEGTDIVKLFHSLNIPPPSQNLSEMAAEAENFKVKGNDAMKDGDYQTAIDHYTKAIKLNSKKAIYYCNRAAAFSRVERDNEAILDCKEAIKLDPSYGKAYGRLGIAYSNLSMFKEAADAYKSALQLDPTNASYEANLKLAQEKIVPNAAAAAAAGAGLNFDFAGFMNNPALLNMASQMLNDPSFRNMVSGIMTSGPGGDPNLDSFVEVGQQLAEHMQANNPNVMENLRQTFSGRGGESLDATASEQPPQQQPPNTDEKKTD